MFSFKYQQKPTISNKMILGTICLLLLLALQYEILDVNISSKSPMHTVAVATAKRIEEHQSKKQSLDSIHNLIWQQIEMLQEEGDCEEKKIIHCENTGNFAGLGSMIHRYVTCAQVAFGLGRIFFIHQREYAHFGGLNRWLKDESNRCGYLKSTYR